MFNYQEEYIRWRSSPSLSDSEKKELLDIASDSKEQQFRFYSNMSFGTAGLRSTMGLGLSLMNKFTVAHTTRGIAKLVKDYGGAKRGVVIAYDSRNNSEYFAKITASILASENVKVYIFDGIRPTPELSFAVRELSAMAGINITASHNPKEYNGYKAYWEDGSQISPEQAEIVSKARDSFDVLDVSGMCDFDESVGNGKIIILDNDFDELYISAVTATAINSKVICEVSHTLKVVYTPLHGAGYKMVPEVFRRVGLKHLYTVNDQMDPDGNFPTVLKPNPEYPAVFKLGIDIANKVSSDLIIATDPDSDRVGVMTRNKHGEFIPITGNQMGALLLDYVINARKKQGSISKDSYAVKSLVSTDMAYKIADSNNIKLYDVLTGFKFIGEVIKNNESVGNKNGFLLGFEESYGYLLGSYARDKDAVEASMLILEMTAFYKKENMTLSDALEKLYETYGYYSEKTIDIYMEGLDGIEKRRKVMQSLRDNPIHSFGGYRVSKIIDYKLGRATYPINMISEEISLPSSDIVYFLLENDDKIIVRPSGTEPKIKIYILAHDNDKNSLEKKIGLYVVETDKIANN